MRSPITRRLTGAFSLSATVIGSAAVAFAGTAQAAAPTGEIQIVHGVRGLLADVWLDNKPVLTSFAPERVTNPLNEPVGTHTITVRRHGASPSSAPLLTATVRVRAGAHVTTGLGLSAAGRPFATTWDDDAVAGPMLAGRHAGLVVRDLAGVSSVRVIVDGKSLPTLSPARQATLPASVGVHRVEVWSGFGMTRLLPVQQVPIQAGVATGIYLIGTDLDSSLGWLAVPLDPGPSPTASGGSGTSAGSGTSVGSGTAGSSSAPMTSVMVPPQRVDTGNSGLARDLESTGGPATGLHWYALPGSILLGSILLAAGWVVAARSIRVARRAWPRRDWADR